jgi:hypothetical protein
LSGQSKARAASLLTTPTALLDPELHRDCISGLEPDAADVPRQPIGILRHDLDGVGAVGLEDADRPSRADAVAVQEHHDLADNLLLGPGGDNSLRSYRPDAVDLPKAIGLVLDIEDLSAKAD